MSEENITKNTKKKNISGNTTPEKRFKAGPISTTIWENDGGEKGSFYTISISRSYKDKNGDWQSTNSLRLNDLPKATIVLQKAYEYLVLRDDSKNIV